MLRTARQHTANLIDALAFDWHLRAARYPDPRRRVAHNTIARWAHDGVPLDVGWRLYRGYMDRDLAYVQPPCEHCHPADPAPPGTLGAEFEQLHRAQHEFACTVWQEWADRLRRLALWVAP